MLSKRGVVDWSLQANQWFVTHLAPLIFDCLRPPWLKPYPLVPINRQRPGEMWTTFSRLNGLFMKKCYWCPHHPKLFDNKSLTSKADFYGFMRPFFCSKPITYRFLWYPQKNPPISLVVSCLLGLINHNHLTNKWDFLPATPHIICSF